jgi:hypothetical protein
VCFDNNPSGKYSNLARDPRFYEIDIFHLVMGSHIYEIIRTI